MVRNTAREIAIHLSYALNFTSLTPEQLLETACQNARALFGLG